MNTLPHRTLLAATLALITFSACVRGAVFYMPANQSSTTFNTASTWNSEPDGTGTAATTLNGHDFISQGFTLRTGTGNSTFGNASTRLFLTSGSGKGLVVRSSSGSTNVTNLIMQGGSIRPGNGNVLLTVTNMDLDTGGSFRPEDDGSARILNVNIGTLTGAGNLAILAGASGSRLNLGITSSALAYSGDMVFTGSNAVTLDFTSDFTSGGGLVLTDALSRVVLDQAVTFASLSINSVSLAADTYTWAELNTIAPTIFNTAGVGSITVVPEPSAMPLVLLAGGFVWMARRPRRCSGN